MKKQKKNIICAWVLLVFFAAGQYMVFSHTHKQAGVASHTKLSQPVLKERCDICDAMHHSFMVLDQQVYFTPAVSVNCKYVEVTSGVMLIQLVLASGRAPPLS